MKAMLATSVVFGLLILSGHSQTPAAPPSAPMPVKKHDKDIERCAENLRAIGKAIEAYQQAHGDYPQWLSDLHPQYLLDASLLMCPADTASGTPLFTDHIDPKRPTSYAYQFHPEYRERKSEQRLLWGDVIPLICCRHHANQDVASLNLSFAFKIYTSSSVWQYAPEEVYGSYAAAIAAFEDTLARYPDDRRAFKLYPKLVRLYAKVGNKAAAAARFAHLKPSEILDVDGYRRLFDLLIETEQYPQVLEIFKEAEQAHPDARPILEALSYIYKMLGNSELAAVYDRKSDPIFQSWGKPVANFSAVDLNGDPISLQVYRGKVVLLDFWATWCRPCIAEMPNIKRVYNTYKDKGFDIIGIVIDDKKAAVRDFIKEHEMPWRQIYSGHSWPQDPLAKQFQVTELPKMWLIHRDGTLISHKVSGATLEAHVAAAVKAAPALK